MSIDIQGYTALITGGSSGMALRWQGNCRPWCHSRHCRKAGCKTGKRLLSAARGGAGCIRRPHGCQRRGLCHKSG
jgi:hypothetical protein